ncbi:MAG: hypothetical protein ACXACI_03795 [Candidatus Hodarchaeales archaeon]|jgi:hypothetical protein
MSENESGKPTVIRIRGWPDVIYFYPTVIASFILPLITNEDGSKISVAEVIDARTAMLIFMVVFFFNLFVISVDFAVTHFALIAVAIFAIILLVAYYLPEQMADDFKLDEWIGVNEGISSFFYLVFGVFMVLCYIFFWIKNRFVYFEIRSTEIFKHSGLFEDTRRFGNAQHAHISKSTPDIFEKIMWLSGDFHIRPEGGESFMINNVFRAGNKEKVIREILSYVPDR